MTQLTTMATVQTSTTSDPVVVYDLLRETATLLIAHYAEHANDGVLGAEDIAAIRSIRTQVSTIDPSDMDAQRKLTVELRARLD